MKSMLDALKKGSLSPGAIALVSFASAPRKITTFVRTKRYENHFIELFNQFFICFGSMEVLEAAAHKGIAPILATRIRVRSGEILIAKNGCYPIC
jgi:hypothetical protein